MEDEAELVPGVDGRQDDPAAGPARHVEARRLDGRRGRRQPCGLCVAAEVGGNLHREGRQRSGGDVEIAALDFVADAIWTRPTGSWHGTKLSRRELKAPIVRSRCPV